MGPILRRLSILFFLIFTGNAFAGQWVATPTNVPGTGGVFKAGGGCAAWVKITGDHLLFFDVWSGEWTELTLPETHPVQRVEAAGNLVLVVFDDLAVVFNGPEQSVHPYELTGTLLNTSYLGPSFGCSDELAAVLTDAEFIVFDARLDSWRVLDDPLPGDYVSYQSLAIEPDFAVADLNRAYPNPSANRAYSLHTGTFTVTDQGVSSISSGHLLDHGYAGMSGFWPDHQAVGYCAFTGEITVGATVNDGLLGGPPILRDRRDLSHVWAAKRDTPVEDYENEHQIWVFDSLTGNWDHHSFSYDRREATPYSNPVVGGQFVSICVRDDDNAENSILYYSGQTHAFTWHDPEIFGNSIGQFSGGSAGGWQGGISPDPPVWWCRSVQHPEGQYTTSTRDWTVCSIAGDDWISAGQRTVGDDLMDLFFYHGPTNTMTQVQTWAVSTIPSAGAHVYTLTTSTPEVQVTFYSSVLNTVEQRSIPSAFGAAQVVNDYLALVFTNGFDDFLFDARTGVVHSRGIDYTTNGLGANLAIGFDSSGNIAHGYSAVTETWSTQSTGSAGYGFAGGDVAFYRLQDGSKYWAYNALDDSWTELVTTGGAETQEAGGQTIIVCSTDRAWAYWPFDDISAVDDAPDGTRIALAHAVAQVSCHPNPFNGRVLVEFSLPVAAKVKIQVFDLRGRLVKTLMDQGRQPGTVAVPWQTERVASGTYLVRIAADEQVATRKLVLVQ